MHFAREARQVLLDASPVRRFLDVRLLTELALYLGQRALVTPEVAHELDHVKHWRVHESLKLLREKNPPWPALTPPMPDEVEKAIMRIQVEKRGEDDGPLAHLGEISTVLVADHHKVPLIVADDRLAKQLARPRGIPRIPTAMLAAEMVVFDALSEKQGWLVYGAATPDEVGKPHYRNALSRARAAKQ